MDYLYILFGLAIFVAVVLLVEGVYVSWNSSRGPEAKRIARRLQAMSAGSHSGQSDVSILKKRLLSESPDLQRLLLQIRRIHNLDRLLQQSGTAMNVSQFSLVSVACVVVSLLVLLMFHVPVIVTLAGAAASATLPWLWVLRKRRQRMKRIEEQLPDALDLLSRALRAGHALPSAIQMVADEMADPIAGEFRIVFDEVNYGVSMQDALNNLSTRIPGTDVGYFVVAVLIQRETGGNLTELLGNIATIVRERLKLFGQIRTLSAEGRLSAWILCLLPFVLAALMSLINPEFMKLLWTDPVGKKLLVGMAVFMLFGIVWMRKVIRIRV